MTRRDFQRLDRELDNLRRNIRHVGGEGQRLNQSLGAVQGRMRRLSSTGTITTRELAHMRQSLSLVSREALHAARSGAITRDEYKNLRSEINRTRLTFDALSRDIQLHRTRVRGAANDTQRLRMAEERLRLAQVRSQQTSVRLTQNQTRLALTRQRLAQQQHVNAVRLRQSEDRLTMARIRLNRTLNNTNSALRTAANTSSFAGGVFSNLRAKLIALALVLIASVLPTIGALAPMLTGLVVVAGAAALAFDDLKKFAKQLKPEFKGLQETASKAIQPSLKRSLDDARKAMEQLNPIVEIGAKAFGQLVEKTARGMSSDKFIKSLTKNAEMGSKWVLDFARSFGVFTQSFLDFGAKSQPALDAWQRLLGGFLDTGLPNMFKELERGIGGSSTYLKGFADFLNTALLPTLAKVIASFMQAFGPLLGQVLRFAGDQLRILGAVFAGVMEGLEPLTNTAADVFRGLNEALEIGMSTAGNLAKAIGSILGGALAEVTGYSFTSMQEGFEGFSTWVKDNGPQLRAVFTAIGLAVIDMVVTSVNMLPGMAMAFQTTVDVILVAIDMLISGLAVSLGNVPGFGWLKQANEDFDAFAKTARESLDSVVQKTTEFALAVNDRSRRPKMVFEVDQAQANLDYIKAQLKDPELTKERKAELKVQKEEAEATLKAARANLHYFDQEVAEATLSADPRKYFANAAAVNASKLHPKRVIVTADPSSFWGTVRGLAGRVLGTSYIDVRYRRAEASLQPRFTNAMGGIMRFYAHGGMENHVAQVAPAGSYRIWGEPETGGEAYIPLSPTKRPRSRMVAEDTVSALGGTVEWYANGGTKDARKSLAASFTASLFNRLAGNTTPSFERTLGRPENLGALITSLGETLKLIKDAFAGGTEKRLVARFVSTGRALIAQEKKLTKVNASLDKAKTKLDDLKQSASSLRESVASGVMGETAITRGVTGDRVTTLPDIMTTMQGSRDKATAFARALADLKAKGFSGEIIRQVAEAGIGGGGLETAGALLTASASDIASFNSMQAEISAAAKAAGVTAADAMYGAGIKAAEGLVNGLTAQKKAIEKAMMDIAKSMEKAIKKALGIKSPSKVMQDVGHDTAQGFALGMADNRDVDTAWSSMLNRGPAAGGSATAAAGGGTYTLPVYIGNKLLDEIILDSNRRTVRTRGGNVQNVYGQRNS